MVALAPGDDSVLIAVLLVISLFLLPSTYVHCSCGELHARLRRRLNEDTVGLRLRLLTNSINDRLRKSTQRKLSMITHAKPTRRFPFPKTRPLWYTTHQTLIGRWLALIRTSALLRQIILRLCKIQAIQLRLPFLHLSPKSPQRPLSPSARSHHSKRKHPEPVLLPTQ